MFNVHSSCLQTQNVLTIESLVRSHNADTRHIHRLSHRTISIIITLSLFSSQIHFSEHFSFLVFFCDSRRLEYFHGIFIVVGAVYCSCSIHRLLSLEIGMHCVLSVLCIYLHFVHEIELIRWPFSIFDINKGRTIVLPNVRLLCDDENMETYPLERKVATHQQHN